MSSAGANIDVPNMLTALGIKARPRGREWWAPCPAHAEKTPSWSIRSNPGHDDNGSHYCWGCGFEGGAPDLVTYVLDVSGFAAAMAWLRDKGLIVGASIPESLAVVVRTTRGQAPVNVPGGIKFGPLSTWSTAPRRYAESRGITPAQVLRWGLGYGVDGRLAYRLFLPAYDSTGRLASWTARGYVNQTPKYRDPDDSDGPDRAVVYGERFWPAPQARKQATLVLAEGELNALAIERAGARYVGALGGSGLDKGQALRIATFGAVVIATDMDAAGSKAADGLRGALARWGGVRRCEFPQGKDACDIEAEQGTEALADLINEAQ